MNNKNKASNEWYQAIGLISMISFELVITTGAGAALGYYLYKHYNAPQSLVLVTTLLGFTLGLFWVMRLLKQYGKNSRHDAERDK